jgi:hypothetical protein
VSADDRLDALAGSVSDGRPVDWNQEETEADPDEESSVRALRDVSLIAEFSRDLQRGVEETSADEDRPEDETSGALD